jgi:hypothetical protein
VIKGTDSPTQPLLLGDLIGERTIAVQLRDSVWCLPLMEGERVAVMGTLATQPDGTRQLTNATIQWLGAL